MAQQVQTKRRRRWPWVILGAIVVLIVVVAVSTSGGGSAPAPAAAPAGQPEAVQPAEQPAGDVVTYKVTGDNVSKASVTYIKDSQMGQEQQQGVALPWQKNVTFDGGAFTMAPLSLVAQSMSQTSGTITCTILRGDKVVTSSSSSGPFAAVTCAGS